MHLQRADQSSPSQQAYKIAGVLQSARVFPIATTAWILPLRALLPPSTRVSVGRARLAAARHRVPGASPVSGVLGHGAAAAMSRARLLKPFFLGCPIVLVNGSPCVLENGWPGFDLAQMDQS